LADACLAEPQRQPRVPNLLADLRRQAPPARGPDVSQSFGRRHFASMPGMALSADYRSMLCRMDHLVNHATHEPVPVLRSWVTWTS